jgi:hypothetical protein
MNIVIRIDQYDDKCIYFCEPIKNNIMNDGNFIRILYTNPQVTLNGVYIFIKLNDILCEKYYNKYKCNFDIETHSDIINNLKVIEENILKKLNVKEKIPQYKIYEQIKNGNIKIFNDIGNKSSCSFILKISGIWETASNFGLTYKFVKVD